MNIEQKYIDLYASHRQQMMDIAPAAMNARRDEAFDVFRRQGFPTLKDEQYRYTDTHKAFDGNYRLALPQTTLSAQEAPVAVNNVSLLDKYYSRCADNSDSIVALNTAFATECLCIHVGKNHVVERPLEVNDVLSDTAGSMEHKRILVVLDEGASLTLLLHYTAVGRQKMLATQVVEVFAADNTHFDMYEIEETNTACTRFNNVYFQIGDHASVSHNGITLFNGITRNTIHASLLGQFAAITLNGCAMESKTQHVDVNTLIRHEVPNGSSRELYKFVVDDQAVGAFAGKVYVANGAEKTESDEVNQNICIGDESQMFTQPMLEIYADDVKCSHGSTVGKLDETALFYMRQRGIPVEQARQLLIRAFIGQVVDFIPLQTLRQRLHTMVEHRLAGELDSCIGCGLCQNNS